MYLYLPDTYLLFSSARQYNTYFMGLAVPRILRPVEVFDFVRSKSIRSSAPAQTRRRRTVAAPYYIRSRSICIFFTVVFILSPSTFLRIIYIMCITMRTSVKKAPVYYKTRCGLIVCIILSRI